MKQRLSFISLTRSIVMMIVLLIGTLPSTALAYDEQFFQSNDILYYSGQAAACTAQAAAYSSRMDLPSLVGNSPAEKIWNFLTDKERGLTAEQAAGVMGNIQQESNFDPTTVEKDSANPGVGYGIVQWSFERRTALETAAKEQGVPVSDLSFQLAFMYQEAETPLSAVGSEALKYGAGSDTIWSALKKQKTVEDATVFWHDVFEKSSDPHDFVIQVRGKYAQDIFETFKDKVAAGDSAHSSSTSAVSNAAASGGCNTVGGGGLIQTLMDYAWPNYHEGPYTKEKPAYQEVATKLTKEGKWVGGGMAEIGIPAVDCGGFVSILLTQSGFEPNYNYGLDPAKGASNQQYGQLPWAQEHWTYLGNGGSINVSDLRPGDVAFPDGHTFVFVGQVNGFDSQYASASYSEGGASGTYWRAPMSAGTYETATAPGYVWYGKRGNDSGDVKKQDANNPGKSGGDR